MAPSSPAIRTLKQLQGDCKATTSQGECPSNLEGQIVQVRHGLLQEALHGIHGAQHMLDSTCALSRHDHRRLQVSGWVIADGDSGFFIQDAQDYGVMAAVGEPAVPLTLPLCPDDHICQSGGGSRRLTANAHRFGCATATFSVQSGTSWCW